jgi:hypothetical protein
LDTEESDLTETVPLAGVLVDDEKWVRSEEGNGVTKTEPSRDKSSNSLRQFGFPSLIPLMKEFKKIFLNMP